MTAPYRGCFDKEDLRRMSGEDLGRLGVRLLNRRDVVLECASCRETWSPQLNADGKLPFDFWRCPAGCNSGYAERGAGDRVSTGGA